MLEESEDGPFQEPFKELQEEIIEVVTIDELVGVSDAPNKRYDYNCQKWSREKKQLKSVSRIKRSPKQIRKEEKVFREETVELAEYKLKLMKSPMIWS